VPNKDKKANQVYQALLGDKICSHCMHNCAKTTRLKAEDGLMYCMICAIDLKYRVLVRCINHARKNKQYSVVYGEISRDIMTIPLRCEVEKRPLPARWPKIKRILGFEDEISD
jgi:hypothetical protein